MKMAHGQPYPFWKDQQIARATSDSLRYWRELQECEEENKRLRQELEKLRVLKCPRCGHVFKTQGTNETGLTKPDIPRSR